jgi:sodium-coupled neutral amino acid transporter 9
MQIVTNRKDLSIFIKIVSNGFLFISLLIVTIVGFGIYSFTNTEFEIQPRETPDFTHSIRPISLFALGFPSLAGVLCVGYFLHPCSLSIVKNNENQKNNSRDLLIAYMIVFTFFCLVGVFGYFGFEGTYFDHYYRENPSEYIINQNCLNMFKATDPIGFLLRFLLFLFLCSSFPLVNHLLKQMFIIIIWGGDTTIESIPMGKFYLLSSFQLCLPMMFALFYPNVGSILSWSGSVAGLFIIYILPCVVYVKMRKT